MKQADRGDSDGPLREAFSLMAKPAGPQCNLHCDYCFYDEKKALYPETRAFRMSDEVLEAYTRQYLDAHPGPSVTFDWQGGEPTLLGIDFFQRALDLQGRYAGGKHVENTLQTNGILIDDAWCAFLSKNQFLVGLSLDGPEALHDAYRRHKDGRPSFAKVLHALERMQQHGVEVNVLATVNRKSSERPLEVYRFFREHGVRFVQFVPIVEREPNSEARELGISLATPPSLTEDAPSTVTHWSVEPKRYGEFLVGIFQEWVSNDVGGIFVMNFEWSLAAWAGAGPGVCYLSPRCGRNLIVEHDGDVFSCDHFMYPAHRLGNILQTRLRQMVQSDKQLAFGASKETALPSQCRECDVLLACAGGCPKHRFAKSADGELGLNYLCEGFKEFHHHAKPSMTYLLELVRRGIPARKIMEALRTLREIL
jgi:uncharacterized protein